MSEAKPDTKTSLIEKLDAALKEVAETGELYYQPWGSEPDPGDRERCIDGSIDLGQLADLLISAGVTL